MKLNRQSSLKDVSLAAGDALRRAGIRAVLTGGACANLYSRGFYVSFDSDFIVSGEYTRTQLDRALAPIGFKRSGDRYLHRSSPYFIEFPPGPLGIGRDLSIRPVWKESKAGKALVLSATDACRDRLAAFYYWNDRQSLACAVQIALHNRIAFAKVRAWSRSERHLARYEVFLSEIRRARRAP